MLTAPRAKCTCHSLSKHSPPSILASITIGNVKLRWVIRTTYCSFFFHGAWFSCLPALAVLMSIVLKWFLEITKVGVAIFEGFRLSRDLGLKIINTKKF